MYTKQLEPHIFKLAPDSPQQIGFADVLIWKSFLEKFQKEHKHLGIIKPQDARYFLAYRWGLNKHQSRALLIFWRDHGLPIELCKRGLRFS